MFQKLENIGLCESWARVDQSHIGLFARRCTDGDVVGRQMGTVIFRISGTRRPTEDYVILNPFTPLNASLIFLFTSLLSRSTARFLMSP